MDMDRTDREEKGRSANQLIDIKRMLRERVGIHSKDLNGLCMFVSQPMDPIWLEGMRPKILIKQRKIQS